MKGKYASILLIFLAIGLGALSGISSNNFIHITADVVSLLFLKFLGLISLPIIFLSILSTITGMKSFDEMKLIGRKVLKYTISTTVVAASIALLLFIIINPVSLSEATLSTDLPIEKTSMLETFLKMVPGNIVEPFSQNNVFGVALIAAMLGIATLFLKDENKKSINIFFSSLFQALLKITGFIIYVIPLGIWAFMTQFIEKLPEQADVLPSISKYILCVLLANLVQGIIILPLFLKFKGISPIKTFKEVYPAVITAFFSKSSSASLPMALACTTNNGKVTPRVANFSLPLCSVINMNGCAAFILTTVLFVSMSSGISFSYGEMLLWVILATIAAIGNASVPMGCYFLASAFLVGLGAPLYLMGVILPFYALLDMLETALNIWSDCSVAYIVDKELKTKQKKELIKQT